MLRDNIELFLSVSIPYRQATGIVWLFGSCGRFKFQFLIGRLQALRALSELAGIPGFNSL